MNKIPVMLVAALMLFAAAKPAMAYTGPGLGLGALSVAFGIIGSIFLGIVAVIWYPFKKLIKRLRRSKKDDGDSSI